MILRRTLSLVALALTLGATSAASASHYFLSDIDLVAAEARTKLGGEGIQSTDQLLDRIAKRVDRQALAKKTGLEVSMLEGAARNVDMLRVRGIGPKMVRLLDAVGVRTIAELQAQSPMDLFTRVVRVNDERHLSEVVPDADILAGWISQAKSLPIVLEI